MHQMSRGKVTHSDRLERWLGRDQVQQLSEQFKDFYWPVRLNGVPGKVFVMPGGDFAGEIAAGQFASKEDAAAITLRKIRNRIEAQAKQDRAARRLLDCFKAESRGLRSLSAFASIDAVVAAFTGGKTSVLPFSKTGVAANAIGNANDLWTRAGFPAAGGAGSAAPGGVAPTSATTGALAYANQGAVGNGGHYLNWSLSSSVANMGLLLYDRLHSVVKTMNSTATEAVTGTPSRYTSTTSSAVDYAGGNFVFPSNPTTVLAATAHNWTVCQYTNQAGTTARTIPSIAGVSACVVGGVDLAVGNWFMPLQAGDVGIKNLTQMQCSAAVATGTIDFVIGHPIAVNSCPIANLACLDDGLYTTMNLANIMDSACLSFLELPKSATTATTYNGYLRTVCE